MGWAFGGRAESPLNITRVPCLCQRGCEVCAGFGHILQVDRKPSRQENAPHGESLPLTEEEKGHVRQMIGVSSVNIVAVAIGTSRYTLRRAVFGQPVRLRVREALEEAWESYQESGKV